MPIRLDLTALPAVSTVSVALLTAHMEAACVMLYRHKHTPPTTLGTWNNGVEHSAVEVGWVSPTEQMITTYGRSS